MKSIAGGKPSEATVAKPAVEAPNQPSRLVQPKFMAKPLNPSLFHLHGEDSGAL